MDEYWVNVYGGGSIRAYGLCYSNLYECVLQAKNVSLPVLYRIHIKMKDMRIERAKNILKKMNWMD